MSGCWYPKIRNIFPIKGSWAPREAGTHYLARLQTYLELLRIYILKLFHFFLRCQRFKRLNVHVFVSVGMGGRVSVSMRKPAAAVIGSLLEVKAPPCEIEDPETVEEHFRRTMSKLGLQIWKLLIHIRQTSPAN